jgi:Protein of unknown function (DUF2589).
MANTPTKDPALISMAEQFTGLPMDALIGGPLKAAAEANAMMAVTQTEFILNTCFTKIPVEPATTPESYTYQAIMVTMSLKRGVIVPLDPTKPFDEQESTIDVVTTTFELPILTLIPINSLGVDSVDIKFDMEVKSSFSDTTNEETANQMALASSFEAKVGYGIFSASVTGSASYDSQSSSSRNTHYEKSNSAQYSVAVHAGQLPIPEGVAIIIKAFSNAIAPYEMPVGSRTDPSADNVEDFRVEEIIEEETRTLSSPTVKPLPQPTMQTKKKVITRKSRSAKGRRKK